MALPRGEGGEGRADCTSYVLPFYIGLLQPRGWEGGRPAVYTKKTEPLICMLKYMFLRQFQKRHQEQSGRRLQPPYLVLQGLLVVLWQPSPLDDLHSNLFTSHVTTTEKRASQRGTGD